MYDKITEEMFEVEDDTMNSWVHVLVVASYQTYNPFLDEITVCSYKTVYSYMCFVNGDEFVFAIPKGIAGGTTQPAKVQCRYE